MDTSDKQQMPGASVHSTTVEDVTKHDAHEAAERGHVATDDWGNPLVEFDAATEKRLRRKIDMFVMPTVCLLYLFCFIDRANIGNAKIVGFEKDLGLHGYDYNRVLTLFYISYIVFEIPCNLVCKWIGPGWFLPASTTGFGVLTLAMAFINDISAAYAVRFLLGIFEAGMLPGIAYYLSRWYRRDELTFRLSLYMVMTPLAGAFGGLLASAILTLDHFGSLHRWRMIFGIEGIITLCLGLIAFLTVTDRPATARWLTQDERDLAIARIKSERMASTEVLDRFDRAKIYKGIYSPVTLTVGMVFLLAGVSSQGLAVFLPTIVKTIYPKNSVVSQQLHTVPPYVVGAFTAMFIPYLSYKLNTRQIFFIISAPPMMIGYAMFVGTQVTDPYARYGATFLITAGIFVYGTMVNAQVSANVISDTARAAAIGANTMLGNIGGLISMWSYLPFDTPDFRIGNGLNLATTSLIFLLSVGLLLWMRADNKKREKRDAQSLLAGMSLLEIQDLEWKHPYFKWRP
ncbi:uncharacterized protein A1O5_12913 [Cladophialophora psammophila CBS 110553]|uniref:Major facilitator superfamily (MFS) profile domain-containing protein n=1 Tax=Cladophialophora psammophila CBS 110553 TaxID=1182543 RepID=W9VGW2_9EURO|nr:uncharacterized protein A1O5_12913 [Cladophialophora psammophila CBS 110553]EXJ54847.1 hypothetical protein A1O5_12913 [Cladophialophora psammophila CBS 110553]